jgi:Protein of unknown function (DUF2530)
VAVVVTADSLAYVPEPANPSPDNVSGRHPLDTRGLRPSPAPLEVDTFALVAVGEALWLVAFVVLLFFRDGHGLWLQTCAAGFLLGLLGAFLSRHRRG